MLDRHLMSTRLKLRQMYSKERSTRCRDAQIGGPRSSMAGSAPLIPKIPTSLQGTLALAQHHLDAAALLDGTSEHHTSLSQPLGPTATDVTPPSARPF